jgi:hypothetical protein
MSEILNKIKAKEEGREEMVVTKGGAGYAPGDRIAVQRPLEPPKFDDPTEPIKQQAMKTLKVVEAFNETETGRRIFLLENGQYVYDNGMPVIPDDKSRASINILNLGRELEAMEQRRQLQEQKERALEDMRRQADRGRNRAKRSWESDMQTKAIQAQREKQAREKEQAAMDQIFAVADKALKKTLADSPKPAAPKKSAAPLAPTGKFNRKIDWKD